MNRFPLFLVVLLLFRHPSFSQNLNRHDSLLRVLHAYDTHKMEMRLPSVEKRDTVKADLLWELYLAIGPFDQAMAEEYINQLKDLAERLNYKKGLGNAYTGLGVMSLINGKFDKSMEFQKLAFKYRTEANDKWGLACTYYNFGNIHSALSNYPEALNNYLVSIGKAEEINDKEIVAWDYSAVASLYIQQASPDKALDYALKAYDIFKEIGDTWKGGISGSLSLISTAYLMNQDYKKAIEYAQLNYERAMMDNAEMAIAAAAVTLGFTYSSAGAFDKALDYHTKAITYYKTLNNELSVANCYNNLGILYLKVAEDTTGKWLSGNPFEKSRESNLRKASDYFRKGLPVILESKNRFILMENYEMHARVLELLGDYKNALSTYQRFKALKDSIYSEENRNKIADLETKKARDLRKKESEINLLKVQRAKKERVYFISGLVLLLSLSATLYNRSRIKQNSLLLSQEQNAAINDEKRRSDELLRNILPAEVAEEIKTTGKSKAKAYTMVTVMFTDFKDFTNVSERISAELLVDEIHACFSAFDNILSKYKIEKIKTIGDAYICASGLPVSNYTQATDMLNAAFEIRRFMLDRKKEKEARGEIPFELRIGIHTGPVVAGVVGVKKYAYDIWGDTVNIAARMEQQSEAGKINISGATYELVKDEFRCEHRGKIEAKHKGMIDMYFVEPVA